MTDDPNDDSVDLDTMARTIYGEARGEGQIGMQAVANVIMNRGAHAAAYYLSNGRPHPLFGDGSPASACKMPWQFSCWNKNDPNCEVVTNVTSADPIFAEALTISSNVYYSILSDITNSATYYYDKRMPTAPNWAAGKQPCATIGNHYFFNNID